MVSIASINVNGLRNANKRQCILNWFNNKRFDILFLQETHCANAEEAHEWVKDWKGTTIGNYGTHLFRGVSVLISNRVDISILSKKSDNQGRLAIVKIKICDTLIQLVNLYAPNNPTERKQFFADLKQMADESCMNIFAGDFNCVLDKTLDRHPPSLMKDQGYDQLSNLIYESNLIDIFRRRFPDKISYTFQRGQSKSRIDYF